MLKRIVSLMLVLTMLAGYMPTITRGQEMGNTEVTEVTEPPAETTAEEPAEEETAVTAELTTETAEECIPEETVEETVSDEAMAGMNKYTNESWCIWIMQRLRKSHKW